MKDRIKFEAKLIDRIVDRAWNHFPDRNPEYQRLDIVATHYLSGCPLKLRELLHASDTDFAHDIGGIMRHLNHKTFKLEGCFLPRFADLKAMVKQ